MVPDDVSPAEAYRRAVIILADPAARQYVGAIAYHLYDDRSNRDKLKALGESYGIPLWMTEYAFAAPFEWADLVGQFSRFIRPGARRVGVTESMNGLKVSAYSSGAEVVIVAIADGSGTSGPVPFVVRGAQCAGSAVGVRTSATENWAALAAIPVAANQFEVTLPHGSITTLRVTCNR